MPTHIRTFVILLLAVAATAPGAEGEVQTVRLLAIGNSFSANVLNQLPALAKAGGKTLEFQHCMFGGASLAQHWARVEATDKDPNDAKALYNGKFSLRQALAAKPWDVVTIQQFSFISHDATTYQPYAGKLLAVIRAGAPQATVLMHQTWAYRVDDPRFDDKTKGMDTERNQTEAAGSAPAPVAMRTAADMHRLVSAAYHQVAGELGLGLIPVGEAFAQVQADPTWIFVPDTKWDRTTAVFPSLPDQSHSLNVGWHWAAPKGAPADAPKKLAFDGHHANAAGEYLGACVWYAVLFHASPVGVPYAPAGMPPERAKFLQQTAWNVVQVHPAVPAAAATAH